MEEIKKDFEITPVLNAGTGSYEITNYDKLLESATKYVNDILAKHTHDIADLNMFSDTKKDRTDLRKNLDAIKKTRLQVNDLYFGTFNRQLKDIEKLINDADKTLKEQVDKWNEENPKEDKAKVVEPKTYTLTITTFDEKILNVVKDFAIKKGCGIVGE